MMTVQGEVETPIAHARAEGARDRHPSHPRDAAAERERHHGPDQGELPEPHRVPRRVAGRQPHDHRRRGRRDAARQRRHAVHSAGQVGAGAAPGRVSLERGHRAADELVRGATRGASAPRSRRRGSSSRSRCATSRTFSRRCAQREALEAGEATADAEIAGDRDKLFREAAEVVIQNQQARRRCCSAGSRSATAARRASSTSCTPPACSVRRTDPKPRDVLVGLDDLDRICGPRERWPRRAARSGRPSAHVASHRGLSVAGRVTSDARRGRLPRRGVTHRARAKSRCVRRPLGVRRRLHVCVTLIRRPSSQTLQGAMAARVVPALAGLMSAVAPASAQASASGRGRWPRRVWCRGSSR